MSYQVSRLQISDRVRARLNIEGARRLVNDVELTDHTNVVLAAWYDLVLQSVWGGEYFHSEKDWTLTSGQSTVTLPDDWYRPILITADAGQGPFNVWPYQSEEQAALSQSPNSSYYQPYLDRFPRLSYHRKGQILKLLPVPQTPSLTLHAEYYPTAPLLYSPEDNFDSINGYEEWVVLGVCLRVLPKTGPAEMVPLLQSLQQEERTRILENAERVNDRAPRVRILDDYSDYAPDGGFGGGWGGW